jgi:peptidoglycan/xylan/chitin deacetylase (PgdA/CDA1 family)
MRSALKERIRIWLAWAIYYSGLFRMALWWKGRAGPYLVILAYHRAAGGYMREHMRYLSRHFRLRHLEDALRDFYGKSGPTGGGSGGGHDSGTGDRRPMLALTFDDAYLDIYTHALEYARELEIPITVFPVTGYVESGAYFWWLAPDYLLGRTSVSSVVIDGKEYQLGEPGERVALYETIVERLTNATSVEAREAFLAGLEQRLEVPLPKRVDGDANDLELPAGWRELLEMRSSGWVSFGAHTVHHPFLGKMPDVGERGVQAVRDAGYSWAVTTIEGVNRRDTDRYVLRRLPGNVAVHPLVHIVQLAGLLAILSRLRKKRAAPMARLR